MSGSFPATQNFKHRSSPSISTMTEPKNSTGLIIANNDTIRSFLHNSIQNPNLTSELREIASNLSSQPSLPYKSIRTLYFASPSSTKPNLKHLFNGSDFVFSSPKPREKSEELKVRLKKLEDLAERKAYDELVKDITPRKDVAEPFSAYKDQLGFGLHVLLTMFTGYVAGYFAFRALFNHSAVMNAAGGILGLIIFMLVETFLFIIRTSNQDVTTSSTTSVTKKNQ